MDFARRKFQELVTKLLNNIFGGFLVFGNFSVNPLNGEVCIVKTTISNNLLAKQPKNLPLRVKCVEIEEMCFKFNVSSVIYRNSLEVLSFKISGVKVDLSFIPKSSWNIDAEFELIKWLKRFSLYCIRETVKRRYESVSKTKESYTTSIKSVLLASVQHLKRFLSFSPQIQSIDSTTLNDLLYSKFENSFFASINIASYLLKDSDKSNSFSDKFVDMMKQVSVMFLNNTAFSVLDIQFNFHFSMLDKNQHYVFKVYEVLYSRSMTESNCQSKTLVVKNLMLGNFRSIEKLFYCTGINISVFLSLEQLEVKILPVSVNLGHSLVPLIFLLFNCVLKYLDWKQEVREVFETMQCKKFTVLEESDYFRANYNFVTNYSKFTLAEEKLLATFDAYNNFDDSRSLIYLIGNCCYSRNSTEIDLKTSSSSKKRKKMLFTKVLVSIAAIEVNINLKTLDRNGLEELGIKPLVLGNCEMPCLNLSANSLCISFSKIGQPLLHLIVSSAAASSARAKGDTVLLLTNSFVEHLPSTDQFANKPPSDEAKTIHFINYSLLYGEEFVLRHDLRLNCFVINYVPELYFCLFEYISVYALETSLFTSNNLQVGALFLKQFTQFFLRKVSELSGTTAVFGGLERALVENNCNFPNMLMCTRDFDILGLIQQRSQFYALHDEELNINLSFQFFVDVDNSAINIGHVLFLNHLELRENNISHLADIETGSKKVSLSLIFQSLSRLLFVLFHSNRPDNCFNIQVLVIYGDRIRAIVVDVFPLLLSFFFNGTFKKKRDKDTFGYDSNFLVNFPHEIEPISLTLHYSIDTWAKTKANRLVSAMPITLKSELQICTSQSLLVLPRRKKHSQLCIINAPQGFQASLIYNSTFDNLQDFQCTAKVDHSKVDVFRTTSVDIVNIGSLSLADRICSFKITSFSFLFEKSCFAVFEAYKLQSRLCLSAVCISLSSCNTSVGSEILSVGPMQGYGCIFEVFDSFRTDSNVCNPVSASLNVGEPKIVLNGLIALSSDLLLQILGPSILSRKSLKRKIGPKNSFTGLAKEQLCDGQFQGTINHQIAALFQHWIRPINVSLESGYIKIIAGSDAFVSTLSLKPKALLELSQSHGNFRVNFEDLKIVKKTDLNSTEDTFVLYPLKVWMTGHYKGSLKVDEVFAEIKHRRMNVSPYNHAHKISPFSINPSGYVEYVKVKGYDTVLSSNMQHKVKSAMLLEIEFGSEQAEFTVDAVDIKMLLQSFRKAYSTFRWFIRRNPISSHSWPIFFKSGTPYAVSHWSSFTSFPITLLSCDVNSITVNLVTKHTNKVFDVPFLRLTFIRQYAFVFLFLAKTDQMVYCKGYSELALYHNNALKSCWQPVLSKHSMLFELRTVDKEGNKLIYMPLAVTLESFKPLNIVVSDILLEQFIHFIELIFLEEQLSNSTLTEYNHGLFSPLIVENTTEEEFLLCSPASNSLEGESIKIDKLKNIEGCVVAPPHSVIKMDDQAEKKLDIIALTLIEHMLEVKRLQFKYFSKSRLDVSTIEAWDLGKSSFEKVEDLREEFLTRLFHSLDLNSDGEISIIEFYQSVVRSSFLISLEELLYTFSTIDKEQKKVLNFKSSIDLDQFLRYFTPRKTLILESIDVEKGNQHEPRKFNDEKSTAREKLFRSRTPLIKAIITRDSLGRERTSEALCYVSPTTPGKYLMTTSIDSNIFLDHNSSNSSSATASSFKARPKSKKIKNFFKKEVKKISHCVSTPSDIDQRLMSTLSDSDKNSCTLTHLVSKVTKVGKFAITDLVTIEASTKLKNSTDMPLSCCCTVFLVDGSEHLKNFRVLDPSQTVQLPLNINARYFKTEVKASPLNGVINGSPEIKLGGDVLPLFYAYFNSHIQLLNSCLPYPRETKEAVFSEAKDGELRCTRLCGSDDKEIYATLYFEVIPVKAVNFAPMVFLKIIGFGNIDLKSFAFKVKNKSVKHEVEVYRNRLLNLDAVELQVPENEDESDMVTIKAYHSSGLIKHELGVVNLNVSYIKRIADSSGIYNRQPKKVSGSDQDVLFKLSRSFRSNKKSMVHKRFLLKNSRNQAVENMWVDLEIGYSNNEISLRPNATKDSSDSLSQIPIGQNCIEVFPAYAFENLLPYDLSLGIEGEVFHLGSGIRKNMYNSFGPIIHKWLHAGNCTVDNTVISLVKDDFIPMQLTLFKSNTSNPLTRTLSLHLTHACLKTTINLAADVQFREGFSNTLYFSIVVDVLVHDKTPVLSFYAPLWFINKTQLDLKVGLEKELLLDPNKRIYGCTPLASVGLLPLNTYSKICITCSTEGALYESKLLKILKDGDNVDEGLETIVLKPLTKHNVSPHEGRPRSDGNIFDLSFRLRCLTGRLSKVQVITITPKYNVLNLLNQDIAFRQPQVLGEFVVPKKRRTLNRTSDAVPIVWREKNFKHKYIQLRLFDASTNVTARMQYLWCEPFSLLKIEDFPLQLRDCNGAKVRKVFIDVNTVKRTVYLIVRPVIEHLCPIVLKNELMVSEIVQFRQINKRSASVLKNTEGEGRMDIVDINSFLYPMEAILPGNRIYLASDYGHVNYGFGNKSFEGFMVQLLIRNQSYSIMLEDGKCGSLAEGIFYSVLRKEDKLAVLLSSYEVKPGLVKTESQAQQFEPALQLAFHVSSVNVELVSSRLKTAICFLHARKLFVEFASMITQAFEGVYLKTNVFVGDIQIDNLLPKAVYPVILVKRENNKTGEYTFSADPRNEVVTSQLSNSSVIFGHNRPINTQSDIIQFNFGLRVPWDPNKSSITVQNIVFVCKDVNVCFDDAFISGILSVFKPMAMFFLENEIFNIDISELLKRKTSIHVNFSQTLNSLIAALLSKDSTPSQDRLFIERVFVPAFAINITTRFKSAKTIQQSLKKYNLHFNRTLLRIVLTLSRLEGFHFDIQNIDLNGLFLKDVGKKLFNIFITAFFTQTHEILLNRTKRLGKFILNVKHQEWLQVANDQKYPVSSGIIASDGMGSSVLPRFTWEEKRAARLIERVYCLHKGIHQSGPSFLSIVQNLMK